MSENQEDQKIFYIGSNGCIRRKIDTQQTVDFLLANGYQQTKDPSEAELLLFFTCAADDKSEASAQIAITDLVKKKNPSAKVIIGGCLPPVQPDFVNSIDGLIGQLSPRNMSDIDLIIPGVKIPFHAIPEPTRVFTALTYSELRPDFNLIKVDKSDPGNQTGSEQHPGNRDAISIYEGFKKRSDIIRIAQGCLSQCSYCCIRRATGSLKSRPVTDIVEQCRQILNQGRSCFTLTADDVGAYGLDIGTNIVDLFENLADLDDNIRLAVTGFNPRWVIPRIEDLKTVFLKWPNIFKHFVVPVQATSNRLLSGMERGHTAEQASRLFDMLDQFVPGALIHTHLIIGFPNETIEDVEASIIFMKRFPNVNYYVYPYCDRPNTKSSQMGGKIPAEEAKKRFNRVLGVRSELTS